MSAVQRLIMKVLPARWSASIEAESRTWMMRCDDCGHTTSVWDRGGVRWKAKGTPRVRGRCPGCGRTGWHTISRA
jgi:ribosomal protein S27E